MASAQPLLAGKGSPITLRLRRLQVPGEHLLAAGCERGAGNVFVDEFCMAADVLLPLVDAAVVKAVEGELPLLSKQESLHALLHLQCRTARKARQESWSRWEWLRFIGHVILFRMGEQVRLGCAGCVEATTEVLGYLWVALPFGVRESLNNGFLFHLLEEVEHGRVTSSYLRGKLWPATVLLTYLPTMVFWFLLFLSPPLVLLLSRPSVLLRWRTLPDLVLYYLTFVTLAVAVPVWGFLFWLLPFHEPVSARDQRYARLEALVKERGVAFDVVDECTYWIP